MKRILLPALILASCADPVSAPPVSLRSPSAIAIASGEICLQNRFFRNDTVEADLGPCEEGQTGGIGFVTNEQSDRVAVVDLETSPPSLVNLDPATPGVTHINVGKLPVDVATSPDGRVVYTLNQLDRDISVISLDEEQPVVLDERIRLEDTPITFEVHPTNGNVIVAQGSPSTLRIFDGWNGDEIAVPEDTTGQSIALPATVTDFKVHPNGESAWVAYRDLDRLSVITFEGTCLDATQSAPCVSSEISITFDCNDGIDNDGDGLIDAQDTQCFGPSGAESPLGIGRVAETDGQLSGCSNGEDDDGDGLADREDPDCVRPSLEEDSAFGFAPVTACNDGIDNDGDGQIDVADGDCYGPFGRTEVTTKPRGLDRIAFDQLGLFAYGVDRINSEVVVFDAQRSALIDAPKSTSPRFDGFSETVGVAVTSSPLSVIGSVDPECVASDDAFNCFFRVGAFVSNDSGSIQFVHTGNFFCRLDSVSDAADILSGELTAEEAECLTVPDFNAEVRAEACDEEEPTGLCSVIGNTTTYFDPRFSLLDDFSTEGRVIGKQCEQPQELLSAMEDFARQNASAIQNFTCDSVLMPQPIDDLDLSDGFERAVPSTRPVLTFDEDNAVVVVNQTYDQALGNENWTVTYEGVIDRTERSDAIFPEALENDALVVSTQVRACSRGVETGDHFIVRSAPGSDCGIESDEDDEDFFTFEIVGVNQNSLELAVVADSDFVQELPTRDCFPSGTSYEIRAIDTWVVVGEDSGFFTDQTSVFDVCETLPGDVSRRVGRVKTGETYRGPYLNFLLWEGDTDGEVQAVRDLSFTFSAERNFSSFRFNTERPLPMGLELAPFINERTWLLAVDPEANSIYANDVANSSSPAFLIR